MWRYVMECLPSMGERLRSLRTELDRLLLRVPSVDTDLECAETVVREMNPLAAHLWIQDPRVFHPDSLTQVSAAFQEGKSFFQERIRSQDWLSRSEKRRWMDWASLPLLARLHRVAINTGKIIFLEMKEGEHFFFALLTLRRFLAKKEMRKIGTYDGTSWGVPILWVNAFYNMQRNVVDNINIDTNSIGIDRVREHGARKWALPTFTLPKKNGGGGGAGGADGSFDHLHCFLRQGFPLESCKTRSSTLILRITLMEAEEELFRRRRCLVNQYSQFPLNGNHEFVRLPNPLITSLSTAASLQTVMPDTKVDGNMCLNENAADLLGMSFAWHSFQEHSRELPLPPINGMTPEQIFFLSFAQSSTEDEESGWNPSSQCWMEEGEILRFSPSMSVTSTSRIWHSVLKPQKKREQMTGVPSSRAPFNLDPLRFILEANGIFTPEMGIRLFVLGFQKYWTDFVNELDNLVNLSYIIPFVSGTIFPSLLVKTSHVPWTPNIFHAFRWCRRFIERTVKPQPRWRIQLNALLGPVWWALRDPEYGASIERGGATTTGCHEDASRGLVGNADLSLEISNKGFARFAVN
ncbi:unnamed protein product [Darwinula stevensoni]|uniref:Peptidase M13 C-terminal domain-containing protein n=1 Tax=Darwinula stevensoni TaxID=69355 RepID=A0A7R9A6X3_9CRUS|nr:unnamed protein product [Darwinula stevensoni]CAG0889251.1 unnamed protein product [Darwinula stevensoni]